MFPVDMGALKAFGVQRWMNNYQWPVHWKLYETFVEALFDGLERVFLEVEGSDRETLLAGGDFIFKIRDILHAEAVAAWACEHGLTLDMQQATRNIYQPDFSLLKQFMAPTSLGLSSQVMYGFRSAVRGLVENKHLSIGERFSGSLGLCQSWSLGTMYGLKREALLKHKEVVKTIYADVLLLQAKPLMQPRRSVRLEQAIDGFGEELSRIVIQTLGKELRVHHFSTKYLYEIWKQNLSQASGWIEAVRAVIQKPPQKLHLNEVWKTNNRIISFALRDMGTQVISYTHGNDPAHLLLRQYSFFGYPHASVYVCETGASALAHQAQYSSSVISKTFPVSFTSVNSNLYAKTFRDSKVRRIEGRGCVMVMGYPMNPVRTQYDVTNFFAFHLEAELRMIKLLKSNGFYVIYKAHPDRRDEVEGVHCKFANEVIFEPFEEVVDRADAIVFLTTGSSTFGMALCSRKPVVVLDHKGKRWNPMAYNLFKRRCRFVRSELNDRNQIAFDEKGLLRALELPGVDPDFSIVKEVFGANC